MRRRGSRVAALFADGQRGEPVPVVEHTPLPSATVGWLVAVRQAPGERSVTVDFPRSQHGPRSARLAIAASDEQLDAAVAGRRPVVLVFEDGDPARPIVVGLMDPGAPGPSRSPAVVEADVDGRRVRVTARDEIVLECGKASVSLRRNGRIIIRGTYVETRSEGTNRIKGGQVQIN